MDFVKMEGLGNDFVVLEGPLAPTPEEMFGVIGGAVSVGTESSW